MDIVTARGCSEARAKRAPYNPLAVTISMTFYGYECHNAFIKRLPHIYIIRIYKINTHKPQKRHIYSGLNEISFLQIRSSPLATKTQSLAMVDLSAFCHQYLPTDSGEHIQQYVCDITLEPTA